ncbi:MAG: hypothetical protein HY784_03760 [Chloroflexi bacterium]|nr:hypothetical protein [Chloroflexota bacterium]
MIVVAILTWLLLPPPAAEATACVWTGVTDTGWATTGNWLSCQGGGTAAPAAGDTATIPAALSNQPVISSSVTIAGITINSGASLTINTGGSLTLNGNLANDGTFTDNAGTVTTESAHVAFTRTLICGTFTFNNLTTNNSGFTTTFDCDVSINGSLTRTRGTMDPGSSTITFSSGGSQSLLGGNQHTFYNLAISAGTTLNHTSGKTSVEIRGNFTNNGAFYQDAGSQEREVQFANNAVTTSFLGTPTGTTFARITIDSGKTVNAGAFSITIANGLTRSPWTNNGGTFEGETGTVTFSTDGTFAMSSSGTDNFNNVAIASGQTLNAGSVTMNVAGNWTNDGTFTASTSTVTFNGSNAGGGQTIGGSSATTFNALTINSGALVTLSTLPSASTVTNNGVLKQTQSVNNATVDFVAIGSAYKGASLTTTGNMGSVTVSAFGNQRCTASDSNAVSRCTQIEVGTSQTATLTLYFTSGESAGTCSAVNIWRSSNGYGTGWTEEGGAYTRDCGSDPRSIQVSGVTSFATANPNSFAMTDQPGGPSSPTAVRLTSFSARPAGRRLPLPALLGGGLLLLGAPAALWLVRRSARHG